MRDKTAYRPKAEPPEAVIAAPNEGPAVAVEAQPEAAPAEPQSEALRQHDQQVSAADEAALALQKQIAELRKSEELNRQRARISQDFAFWKQNGLSPDQEQLLIANPALMVQLGGFAATEAAKQHQVGTPEFAEVGKKLFFENLERLQQQAHAEAGNGHAHPSPNVQAEADPMPETPAFFRAPPPPKMQPRSVPVSAPVSRAVPSAVPPSERYEENPSRVTLTAEQVSAAHASGITTTEYARQLIRMNAAKRRGEIV